MNLWCRVFHWRFWYLPVRPGDERQTGGQVRVKCARCQQTSGMRVSVMAKAPVGKTPVEKMA